MPTKYLSPQGNVNADTPVKYFNLQGFPRLAFPLQINAQC